MLALGRGGVSYERGNPVDTGETCDCPLCAVATLQRDFILTCIHEYDPPQEIGAIPSEMRLTAEMPWGGIVSMMHTRLDKTRER